MNSADKIIPVLSQSNTYLREFKTDDSSSLFRLIDENRNFLRKWLFWVDFTNSEKDSLNFIVNSSQQVKEGNSLILALFHEGKLAGCVSFVSIDQNKHSAMLGYWIGQEFQGRGLITNSCLALIKHGFDVLGLEEIYSRAVTINVKSVNIFRRIGFICQAQDKEEQYHDGKNVELDMTFGILTKQNWLKLVNKSTQQ